MIIYAYFRTKCKNIYIIKVVNASIWEDFFFIYVVCKLEFQVYKKTSVSDITRFCAEFWSLTQNHCCNNKTFQHLPNLFTVSYSTIIMVCLVQAH